MLYQFFRNNLFIIVICACGLLVIAGHKILLSTEFSNNPEIISSGTPSAQEQTVDDRKGNWKIPKTSSRRKGNFGTGHSHSVGDLPIPEISEEKRKRISALYDGYLGNDGNLGNRDPSWAKDGPPQEEIDILVEGMDNLSAAKYLKALVFNDYAREYADKALAENPDDFETLFIWTRLRSSNEDADRVAGYRKLLEMDPNFVPALVGLGSKLKEESPEEAIELLQKANSLDPSEGLYQLAWAYQRIGEYDKAVPMLQKAYERYNRRWMLSEIKSIEAGTPQIPLIQRESQEDLQNEGDNKVDKALLTEPVPPASDEFIEIETEKGAHNPFRTDLDKLNSDTPNSDAEIRAFFEQLADPELAEFKKYLTKEFPALFPEEQAETQLREDIDAGNFSPKNFNQALETLKRYGPQEGLHRISKDNPKLARYIQHMLNQNSPKEK